MRINSYLFLLLAMTITDLCTGQDTQGFFADDFKPKEAVIPESKEISGPVTDPGVSITVNFQDTVARVLDYIYGNNANVYMTQMISQPELINHIRLLNPNLLRYPGGNLSNMFFWNAKRRKLPADVPNPLYVGGYTKYSDNFWYGKNKRAYTLSVDNYYKMLEQTNSTGIICVNYAYARYGTGPEPVQTAAKLAADWVRYDNGRTKFWEIGNENYGAWQAGHEIDIKNNKDGQPKIISGELYGKHFRIFADSMRAAAKETGADIKLGAVMVEIHKEYDAPIENGWNRGLLEQAGDKIDFYVVHSYYTPYNDNSTAAVILNTSEKATIKMVKHMNEISAECNVSMKPVALTEWNIFATGSKQSCSFINGIHATMVLGELIKNRFGMACRWDLVNRWADGNDHGMFNYGDEPDVPRWNPRPVYFYMYFFQRFFGDHMVSSSVSGNKDVVAYASKFSSGEAGIVVVNRGKKEQVAELVINDFKYGKRCYIYTLTGGDDNGEFSQKVFVNRSGPDNLTGGPVKDLQNIKALSQKINKGIKLGLPAYSVLFLLVEDQEK
ncbi:MAG: alpha-L-arabinofuranosidase [Bacteroidales bacterium]|nr:MAG: alpha-L-arabinofuranosidase [Bacteroidales bacterium]